MPAYPPISVTWDDEREKGAGSNGLAPRFMQWASLAALVLVALAAASPAWAMKLERVVLVQRHGVRPPISSNADLAKYSAAPWPAWPVPPGELTAHGGETVRLMGDTLRAAYLAQGLLPASGCPAAGVVEVWADGTDQRTRRSGEILAAALAPGCGVTAGWAAPEPRDPIFGGSDAPACKLAGAAEGRAAIIGAAGPSGVDTPATRAAIARLQAILAPEACHGGPGMCLTPKGAAGAAAESSVFLAASLSEDLLLEYAEGMPAADVGWGKAASAARIAAIMAPHERVISLIRHSPSFVVSGGAPMARLVIAALAAEPSDHTSPATRILALAGHDTNLTLMEGLFGLDWTTPGEPDGTAPAMTLAFELWSNKGGLYVRPVLYYETLDQLRALTPAHARRLPLTFAGCASGPSGSCPLPTLRKRVESLLPPGCG
jgi:4-phytase/acid phosphatase